MTRRPLTDPTAVIARRGGAWFIDLVLCGLAGAVPALLLADAYSGNHADGGGPVQWIEGDLAIFIRDTTIVLRGPDLAITLGAFAVAVLVFLVLLPGRKGWSPGYLAADLRLERRDGERAGIGRALVRTIAWVIDILPGLPLVAYTSASLTRRHQRVGDLLARTYVVDKRAAGRPVDAPLEDIAEPVFEPETVVLPEPEGGSQVIVGPSPEPDREPGSVAERDPVAVAVAARSGPPDGVPPDEPIWDRRRQRYVLWHSEAGRWLEHGAAGWAPLAGDGEPGTPPTDGRGKQGG
ncbi:MAG TPA: RDD family protein [Acidimicrobiales bacterium]